MTCHCATEQGVEHSTPLWLPSNKTERDVILPENSQVGWSAVHMQSRKKRLLIIIVCNKKSFKMILWHNHIIESKLPEP